MSEVFDALSSLNDIQGLIDSGVRESQTLEYKTIAGPFSDNDKVEIAKDVSAMANSGGGVIIYGVATDRTDKTPTTVSAIHHQNVETFDRVVNSQVKPPVKWSKKLFPTDAAPDVMGIDVHASSDPPHQSLHDKRYYRRSGTHRQLISRTAGKTVHR
jgi:predicted HTH transcriptional regulator